MRRKIIIIAPTFQRAQDWARSFGFEPADVQFVSEGNACYLRGTEQGFAVVLADSNRRSDYDEVLSMLRERRYSVAFVSNTI